MQKLESNNPPQQVGLFSNYCPKEIFSRSAAGSATQQEFLQRVLSLAACLPDQRYLINLCRDRYYFAVAFCAALVKRSTNLLPPNKQPEVLINLASKYRVACCLVDDGISPDGIDCIDVREIKDSRCKNPPAYMPMIYADHIAAVVFTSGSTGEPTAIEKQWRTLTGTAHLLSMQLCDALKRTPSIIATVPAQHMYGLEMSIMMPLHSKSIMVSTHPFFPHEVADSLANTPEPRCLVTTPVHMRAILESGMKMPPVNKVISATAPLSNEIAKQLEQLLSGSVEEIYGCTEAGSLATRRTTLEDEWHMLPGMELSMEQGQVFVSGEHLPEKTKLHDRIEIIDERTFRFLGRSSDLVNVAGKRASLADLTHKLLCIEGIEDAVVFLPEEQGREAQRLAALVVSDLSDYEICRRLVRKIDPVFVPRPMRKVACLPRNEMGKISFGLAQEMLKTIS